MNWWIDEAFYPGPDEHPLNLVPNPLTALSVNPPVAPKPGDVWVDTSTSQIYQYQTNSWKEVRT